MFNRLKGAAGEAKKRAATVKEAAISKVADGVALAQEKLDERDEQKREAEAKIKENEKQAELLKSSLDGQDLTFKHAWEAFGIDNASNIFDCVGQTFEGVADDRQQTDKLKEALIFLTKSNKDLPTRWIRMSRIDTGDGSEATTHITPEGASADDMKVEEFNYDFISDVTHNVQLEVNDTMKYGSYRGHIENFFSLEGVKAFVPRVIECFEVHNDATCRLFTKEFEGLKKTFSFFADKPITTMNDRACGYSHKPHIARLIDFRIPFNLDEFKTRNYPWTERILNWMHVASVELLDGHTIGKSHSKRRAFSLKWDRSQSSAVFEAVKIDDCLLWHNKEDMIRQTIDYNNTPRLMEKNKVSFKIGSTFVIRLHFKLHLVEIGSLNATSSGTTLYFQATLEDRILKLNLIDITGLKGRLAKLTLSSLVEKIAESVQMIFQFMEVDIDSVSVSQELEPEDTGANQHGGQEKEEEKEKKKKEKEAITLEEVVLRDNKTRLLNNRFFWHICGVAPVNSVLLWLVKILWDKIVMSDFLFEVFNLWSLFWRGLAADIKIRSKVMYGDKDSLQRTITRQQVSSVPLDGKDIRMMFEDIVLSARLFHSKHFVHGDIRPETISFDNNSRKWVLMRPCLFTAGTSYSIDDRKNIPIGVYSPPESVEITGMQGEGGEGGEGGGEEARKRSEFVADPSFDVWALGMILYQLQNPSLTPLFADCCGTSIGKRLVEWRMETEIVALKDIENRELKNLLIQMLYENVEKRITLDRVLSHPYVTRSKFLRLTGEKAKFDVFISYRVSSDSQNVKILFDKLVAKGLKVWWDQSGPDSGLSDGLNWETGFVEGLVDATTFVCFLSNGAIFDSLNPRNDITQRLVDSPVDNVLLEWRLALELRERNMIKRIFPVMIGELLEDGSYGHYPFAKMANLPDNTIDSVDMKVRDHLYHQGQGPPYDLSMSVSSLYGKITQCQGQVNINTETEITEITETSGDNSLELELVGNINVAMDSIADRIFTMVQEENYAP